MSSSPPLSIVDTTSDENNSFCTVNNLQSINLNNEENSEQKESCLIPVLHNTTSESKTWTKTDSESITTTRSLEFLEKSFRKYTYYFSNHPLTTSVGYLTVFDKKIIACFSERTQNNNFVYLDVKCIPQFNLFINKIQLLSFDWLPIYTVNDLEKIQDMFYKFLNEYQLLENQNYPAVSHFPPIGTYNVFETYYVDQEFSLSCHETFNSTDINIKIKESTKTNTILNITNENSPPVHLQIYIGSYLVFCSQRDLQNLSKENVNYIINFLFSKASKC
ncbi:MAG: hypothetical protein ACK48V_05570 [Crocinitomicaceae bacterium]